MMNQIRQLCVLSVLCGTALQLTPEGGVKRAMAVLCAMILSASLLSALHRLNLDAYALETARQREEEHLFLTGNSDRRERLNRLVIEQEYETYILDKAGSAGLELTAVAVEAKWDMDGIWVPHTVQIGYRGEERLKAWMTDRITGDLGIPKERQYWSREE